MAGDTDKRKSKQKGKKTSKLKILPSHASAMKETERHIVAVSTVRSHNNRLTAMINWVKENYSTFQRNNVKTNNSIISQPITLIILFLNLS